MTEHDKITVIIPVYKVEKYLDRCIRSVVEQSYSNLEIVLVNDGSPDKCPQICDSWAKKDYRIRVIHQKNKGLSAARNAGLSIATGQYVGFVDSDDWIDKNLYDILLSALKETKSDIACCTYLETTTEKIEKNYNNKEIKQIQFDCKEALRELICDGKIKQVVWNKLYKKTVVKDLWFPDGKYHEDEFWSYQVVGMAKKIVLTEYEGYFYFQREDSIMRENYSPKRIEALEAKDLRQKYLSERYPDLIFWGKRNLLYSCIYQGQMGLRFLRNDEKEITMKTIENFYDRNIFDDIEIKKLTFKDKLWIKMCNKNFTGTCMLRNIFNIGF